MPITFPSNPNLNETYSVGDKTWVWVGTRWRTVANIGTSGGGGASVTVSGTAPASPSEGNLWMNSETGDLYVYAGGGWIVASGPAGPAGPAGSSVNAVVNSYVWFTG